LHDGQGLDQLANLVLAGGCQGLAEVAFANALGCQTGALYALGDASGQAPAGKHGNRQAQGKHNAAHEVDLFEQVVCMFVQDLDFFKLAIHQFLGHAQIVVRRRHIFALDQSLGTCTVTRCFQCVDLITRSKIGFANLTDCTKQLLRCVILNLSRKLFLYLGCFGRDGSHSFLEQFLNARIVRGDVPSSVAGLSRWS
jgi:hypothetical protein